MKQLVTVLSLVQLFALVSCSKPESTKSSTYSNDFETMGYWTERQNITRETARSGLFSTFCESGNPFTQTLKLNWLDLNPANPKSVEINTWVCRKESTAKGKLVFSIESNGQNVVWQGIEIQNSLPETNQWYEIKMQVDLKTDIPDDAIIKIYGASDSKERIYMDDFLVQFEY